MEFVDLYVFTLCQPDPGYRFCLGERLVAIGPTNE